MNNQFELLKQEFLRAYAFYHPNFAFSSGWREYAGIVPDYSKEMLAAHRQFLTTFIDKARKIDETTLDEVGKIDLWVMINHIESLLFDQDILDVYRLNPMVYTGSAFIFDYLLKQYAPLEQRVKEMSLHLNQLPRFYQTAIENLDFDNLAKEHITMTVSMLKGMLEFFNNIGNEIRELSKDQGIVTEETIQMAENSAKKAQIAIGVFLDKLENAKAQGSFRMGKEKFQKMLWAHERVNAPIEEILDAGLANLERNLRELKKSAELIDPNKTPQQILEMIKKLHPSKETLIEETQKMLEGIQQFIIDSDFVSVPSMIMPKVIPTPKPFREWAFAAMDTPGALETRATDSYYYITPPDENWSLEEQESWLTVFNYKQLLDICVHEAFPGHYLHHLHNQRSKSLMAKLFGAYHFWEGYALYVEEAMWHHGFQKDDHEYRMAQLLETLIRNVRLICSIKYHTSENFTVQDGTKMMMEKAFMEEKPAQSEAFRGTYDPGYLNYALGKLMIEKLREDYKNEKGEDFSLRQFHDELLSYGAPPIPLLRKIMLNEDNGKIL